MRNSLKNMLLGIGCFLLIASTYAEVLRTPDSAFAHLSDYPFEPHYVEIDGLRIHYVDEGSENEKVIFLFHGQPSWSYLYRHMIPVFVEAGYRVIAPDLVGFGRSDKPADLNAHTYQAHVDWMTGFVRELGIKNAAAFMQDWGGLIGLRVLANQPEWLSRLVVSNTVLPDATGLTKFIMPLGMKAVTFFAGKSTTVEDFEADKSYGPWSSYFLHTNPLEIGRIVQAITERNLSEAELAGYDAPFPDASFYAGPRRMPVIIGSQLGENHRAWTEVLEKWEHPVLTLFSDKDPFMAGMGIDKETQSRFPGASGQPHTTITDASHFLQEDKGPEIAGKVITWLTETDF